MKLRRALPRLLIPVLSAAGAEAYQAAGD